MLHKTGANIVAPVFTLPNCLHIVCTGVVLCIFFLVSATASGAAIAPDPTRQAELVKLVRNDCGSCHGLLLNGGLGPELTPRTLRDKSNESLVATILFGRPGTPMPPWQIFMTETEAEWIVENLIQGFPNVQSK